MDQELEKKLRFRALREHKEVRPKNESEREFYDCAKDAGWCCSKKGYPDFFLYREKDGDLEIALVEVKPREGQPLKIMQLRILRALSNYGVPCYRWSPCGGFIKIEGGNVLPVK